MPRTVPSRPSRASRVRAHDDAAASLGAPLRVSRQVFQGDEAVSHAQVTHSYAVLSFFTGGRSQLEQKGEWKLSVGDVFLIPPGAPHRRVERQPSESWGLAFCVPCFGAAMAVSLLEPFERVRNGSAPVVRIPPERRRFLEGLFQELEALERRSDEGGETRFALQQSLLTLVLAEVTRAARASQERAPASRHSVVTDSLRYIEKHCLRRLTLGEVARAVGRTPAYVTHALKEATGRSAGEWIVSGRLAEARRLLLHSDEHVDVIAERVGYADVTHFIRMFRREHGETPAAWRQAQGRVG